MALATILRRGSSLAISKGSSSSPLKFLAIHTSSSSSRSFSSSSIANTKDQSLIRVIQSEIKCSQESDDHNRVDEIPKGFPFKIEDIPGKQTIILNRDYIGETIKVNVHMPSLVTGDKGQYDDDDDSEKAEQASIPLLVTVSKNSGHALEFGVTAFPDEVTIDSMSVKESDSSEDKIPYEGPDFTALDENLQKSFHKYLEIRGVKPMTTNFLYEYMINKDSREYLIWLKKLKNFVEK